MVAIFANAIDHHLHFVGYITFREFDPGRDNVIQTDGSATVTTNKMYVLIMMMTFFALLA